MIHKIISKTHAYNLIHRKHEIILFRMRSGNIGLNTNLQKLANTTQGYVIIAISQKHNTTY